MTNRQEINKMALDMDSIIENLYVGGMQVTRDPAVLHELGVTHVVTVCDEPVSRIVDSGYFKYKFVSGVDFGTTDLLSSFPEVTAFIDGGVKSGAVLVHCIAGVSRSVTMVIAFLMEKKGMSFEKALKLVQKKRKFAYPNEGFVKQLKLYEEMHCRLDPTNEEYKLYRLTSLALTMQGNQDKDAKSVFLPGDLKENPIANKEDIIFKCKKCRNLLFKRSDFMNHTVGPGIGAFGTYSRKDEEDQDTPKEIYSRKDEEDQDTPKEICDRSIFIEPVEWMKESIVAPEGKLFCPKCKSKLGSFVWYGERCPCGEWVSPAFHISISKVDECKPVVNVPKTHLDVDSVDKQSDSKPEENVTETHVDVDSENKIGEYKNRKIDFS